MRPIRSPSARRRQLGRPAVCSGAVQAWERKTAPKAGRSSTAWGSAPTSRGGRGLLGRPRRGARGTKPSGTAEVRVPGPTVTSRAPPRRTTVRAVPPPSATTSQRSAVHVRGRRPEAGAPSARAGRSPRAGRSSARRRGPWPGRASGAAGPTCLGCRRQLGERRAAASRRVGRQPRRPADAHRALRGGGSRRRPGPPALPRPSRRRPPRRAAPPPARCPRPRAPSGPAPRAPGRARGPRGPAQRRPACARRGASRRMLAPRPRRAPSGGPRPAARRRPRAPRRCGRATAPRIVPPSPEGDECASPSWASRRVAGRGGRLQRVSHRGGQRRRCCWTAAAARSASSASTSTTSTSTPSSSPTCTPTTSSTSCRSPRR